MQLGMQERHPRLIGDPKGRNGSCCLMSLLEVIQTLSSIICAGVDCNIPVCYGAHLTSDDTVLTPLRAGDCVSREDHPATLIRSSASSNPPLSHQTDGIASDRMTEPVEGIARPPHGCT